MSNLGKEIKASKNRLNEVERILKESAVDLREMKRTLKESAAESDEWRRKFRKSMDEANERFGGFTQSASEILESEFIAALQESKRIGEIALHEVLPNIRARREYDAVCINGKFAIVCEIKHKLSVADVRKFAEEQLPHFAEEFPQIVGKRKIFGAVGGGNITPKAAEEAAARGLFILRLRNRKLVVANPKGARAV